MDKFQIIGGLYRNVLKPVLFAIDPEAVHEAFVRIGEGVENGEWIVGSLLAYKNPKLNKKILGVEFPNPIGLSAGFDYDGHLAKVMKHVGFGFNTVGTVTAKEYGGNARPMLGRLPKSKSLLVNKGFKSEGAVHVMERLDKKQLDGHVTGISVGSSNIPEVNTINKAIDDYLFTFDVFKNRKYVKYFELNISCPNTAMPETFGDIKNFKKLAGAVAKLKIKQPIFVKMANEMEPAYSQEFIVHSVKNNIRGFIFSNLVKDRNNPAFDKEEMEMVKNLNGNFSGKPTEKNANLLIRNARRKFGNEIAIIGCGGVFSAEDAIKKFDAGADLVQLITGMIYEGPQLAGEICQALGTRV
jgi:dihydroorotate dehydrogenase subfamily 2